jgi:hypothetical protein
MEPSRIAAEHDASFHKAMQEALDDPRAPLSEEEVEVHISKLRAEAVSKEARQRALDGDIDISDIPVTDFSKGLRGTYAHVVEMKRQRRALKKAEQQKPEQ